MIRLKDKYRDIQSRFKTLGLAIDAAQIGLQAYPIISEITSSQTKIYTLCKDDPVLLLLALQTEVDLGDQAERLLNYLYGLCLSTSELNQMKPSDRRMLFMHILTQLRSMSGTSRGLVFSLEFAAKKKIMDSLNPFSDFISSDKKLIDDILRKKELLMP
jgi:hypothetical protein